MNMDMTVNLKNVKEFIESQKFTQFLLSNTTDFSTAAFILQTLLDKVKELDAE